ncbi:MAG: DNA-directed RNA polymerase subunit omega [Synergistaceae bacterium]|nr:DNA-directed RNA polymerase subunit omega [Synergistaceae bacterium]
MIFIDLDNIYKDRNIPNKYIMTLVVSARARQLSERKGAICGYDEKFITRAVEDLADGKIKYSFIDLPAKKIADEPLEA